MPSDFQLKTANSIHRGLVKISGGRIGWKLAKMPVIELTTIGRKSGQPRTVMLTSPLQEGPAMVVVASRGGDPQNPAWFLNLSDNPAVEISMNGKAKQPMSARVATSEERARMWPKIASDFKNYANYQTKTDREIPLVLIEPLA